MSSSSLLPPDCDAHRILDDCARTAKCVFMVGLPGVGKTLMLQQLALLARTRGRLIHLLQWDVARQAFETPEILARYPEIDGATHAGIRRAVGLWVRDAVADWYALHTGDEALLLGEAPFVGGRLIELAQRREDRAEAVLASQARFIIPAPTLAVRREIEAARAREMRSPRHARELANASPSLLDLLMLELRTAGVALGVASAKNGHGYDPDIYLTVYRRLLRHRAAVEMPIELCLEVRGSPYELSDIVSELKPDATEVAAAITRIDHLSADTLEISVRRWYEL